MTTQPELPLFDPLAALLREHAEQFRPEFPDWLALNRHVWVAFVREADKVWARGRRAYSARTLIEYLRHDTALADSDAEFKINGNCVADCARLYMLATGRAGFFETRVQAGSGRAA